MTMHEIAVTHSDGVDVVEESEPTGVAASTVQTHIGVLNGTGGPVTDGSYPSDVYLSPEDRFDWPIWQAAGSIGSRDGRGKIWLNTAFATADNYNIQSILHERAHNFGYRHGMENPGVIKQDPPFPDLNSDELHEPTRVAAVNTDGFEVWDFDTVNRSMVRNLVADYIRDDVPIDRDDVTWAVRQYIGNSDIETVLADGTIQRMLAPEIERETEYTLVGAGFYRSGNTGPHDAWGWGWDY